MPHSPEHYYRPESMNEALPLLAQPDVVVLGGGTKLLAMEAGLSVYGVVDLQALGLDEITWNGDILRIGATAKLADLSAFLAENGQTAVSIATLLQKTIQQAGPNTYRNAATLGGTIAHAIADSELLAALLVLEATLTVQNAEITMHSLAEYLSADEQLAGIITAVSIPTTHGKSSSHRVARTPADTPIVSITAWQPEGETPRLAATGIAQRPLLLKSAEAALKNGVTETAVAQAAQSACTHPGDFRGDHAYRAQMAATLTRRTLQSLTPNL